MQFRIYGESKSDMNGNTNTTKGKPMSNLPKHKVKFYGIKAECCIDDNISFLEDDVRYGKCRNCNRVFLTEWKQSVTVEGYRLGLILSAICGICFGIAIGVLAL